MLEEKVNETPFCQYLIFQLFLMFAGNLCIQINTQYGKRISLPPKFKRENLHLQLNTIAVMINKQRGLSHCTKHHYYMHRNQASAEETAFVVLYSVTVNN